MEDLNRLIALSYDSDPEVRKKAVRKLQAYSSHPAVMFALLELAFDQDEGVREEARRVLKLKEDYAVPFDELLQGKVEKVVEKIEEKIPEEVRSEKKDLRDFLSSSLLGVVSEKKKGAARKLLEFLEEEIGTVAEEVEEVPAEEKEPEVFSRFLAMLELGATTNQLQKEAERLKKEVDFALKLALRKKRRKAFKLSELSSETRSAFTPEVQVLAVSTGISGSGKRAREYVKLIVSDGQTQMPVYVFYGKGEGIKVGDRVVFEKVAVRRVEGVLSLVAGKRTRLVIIRE